MLNFKAGKQKVYDVVPLHNQKFMSVRWVCTMKNSGDGTMLRPKARLVARGFEENTSDIASDSPTCSKDSLRALIAVSCQKKWKVNSIDIKTAFLQGDVLDRDVFIKPPIEANCKGYLWKLNKAVYGLTDASLRWYARVKDFMCSVGGIKSALDPALFLWLADGKVIGFVAVHIDDFIWCGNSLFESTVITSLRKTFLVGKEETCCFQYLGLKLQQSLMGITFNQNHYIENLKEIEIPVDTPPEIALNSSFVDALRSKVGQLLWVANQSRPDISFDVSSIAVSLKDATFKDIINVNKIIRKVKNNQLSLQYFSLGRTAKIVAYTDASFANLPDGGSQGGYLIFLVGMNGSCNLLSWQSKRIRRIVRSALAAECLAMSECVDAAIYISLLYKELMFGTIDSINDMPKIEIVTDSKSLCDAIKSVKTVTERRLRVDINAVKEALHKNDIHKVSWVKSQSQLADCLTKHGANNEKLLQTLRRTRLPT